MENSRFRDSGDVYYTGASPLTQQSANCARAKLNPDVKIGFRPLAQIMAHGHMVALHDLGGL